MTTSWTQFMCALIMNQLHIEWSWDVFLYIFKVMIKCVKSFLLKKERYRFRFHLSSLFYFFWTRSDSLTLLLTAIEYVIKSKNDFSFLFFSSSIVNCRLNWKWADILSFFVFNQSTYVYLNVCVLCEYKNRPR